MSTPNKFVELQQKIIEITNTECAHLGGETIDLKTDGGIDIKDDYKWILFYFPCKINMENMEKIFNLCKEYNCNMVFNGKENGKAHAVIKLNE